jgi:hypothetical protein
MATSRKKYKLAEQVPLGKRGRTTPDGLKLASAKDFSNKTEKYGGATMDLATQRVYNGGVDEGHVVGAEPSEITGKRVTTHLYGEGMAHPALSMGQLNTEYKRLKRHVTAPGGAMGSWVNGGRVHMDASRVFADQDAAGRAVIARDEDASFDLKNLSDVTNAEHRQRLGVPGEQAKTNKAELEVPSQAYPGTSTFEDK